MFNVFKKDKKEINLKDVINELDNIKKDINNLSEEITKIKKENKYSFSKIKVIRFNPFVESGGNQSFSIALLDGNNNGVVITSIYSHEGNRVYAKPIENGKSKYPLSKEEEQAIKEAMDQKF